MWLIGGLRDTRLSNRPDEVSEIWSSADRVVWTLNTAVPPWKGRKNYKHFVFDGKLWIVGGADANYRVFNDAWVSADGTNWNQYPIYAETGWPQSKWSDYFTTSDGLWVMEHDQGQSMVVRHSSDGVHWEVTDPAEQIPLDTMYSGFGFLNRT